MKLDSADDSRGSPAPRGLLTRGRIIGAAIELVDEFGLRQLTMRRLGGQLGVEAMTLYRYVPSRENLLDGIVESIIDGLYGDPDVHMSRPGLKWQEYLERLAHGVRRIALVHPEIFPLIATRPPAAPWVRPPLRSLRWMESFLDTLLAQGFSDLGAVAAYRAFSSFLLGHLLLEVSGMGVDTGPVPEVSPAADLDAAARERSLDGYPHLQRLEPELAQDHSADEFAQSLANLLHRLKSLQSLQK